MNGRNPLSSLINFTTINKQPMNENLTISKSNAVNAFKTADDKGKVLLSNLFHPHVLSEKITDRVKNFQDACNVLGIDFNAFNKVCAIAGDSKDEIAYKKLKIIIRALNEGWEPDWAHSNEPKWFIWFQYKPGFGFSDSGYVSWYTDTCVGSRLCFKSRELAEYAAEQFQMTFNEFLSL